MSAETLRKAASLMRERAEKATPGPWVYDLAYGERFYSVGLDESVLVAPLAHRIARRWDAVHIACMDPAVALAVADWLDITANRWESNPKYSGGPDALAVARAYLGEQP
jgi:hypothetical protein